MNLTFILPGRNRNDFVRDGIEEYRKRLSAYSKCEIVYIQEQRTDRSSDITKALEIEADKALSLVKDRDYLILVDIHASQIDSKRFASKIEEITRTNGNIVFYVGSSNGISDRMRKRADFSFCLSEMTFTHYMALLLTIEQVYRAMKIIRGEAYDK